MRYMMQERDLNLRTTLTELRISVPSSIRFADSHSLGFDFNNGEPKEKKVHRRTCERQAWLRALYSASP